MWHSVLEMSQRVVWWVACVGLLCFLCLHGRNGHAQLMIDSLTLDFAQPNVMRRDITLYNSGRETLYVEVQLEEILAGPGEERSSRTGTPDELGLLVTPNRMVLAPGQRRPVRAVLLQRPAVERIYRITMKPVVGALLPDEAAAPKGKAMSVKVLVGYQTFVIARPADMVEDFRASRQGHTLRFENDGAVSVLLRSGRQCAGAETPTEDCAPLPSKRIWPGTVWELKLAHDAPVTYTVESPSGQAQRTF